MANNYFIQYRWRPFDFFVCKNNPKLFILHLNLYKTNIVYSLLNGAIRFLHQTNVVFRKNSNLLGLYNFVIVLMSRF